MRRLSPEDRARLRAEVDRRRRSTTEPPPDPWHGTASGYDHHKCRCDQCRAAGTAARRARRIGVAA